jgi:hypothetical protein
MNDLTEEGYVAVYELLKWINHVDSEAMVSTDGCTVDIDLEDWDHIVKLAKKLST